MGDFIPSERPFWMQIGVRSPKVADCAELIVDRDPCICGTRKDLHAAYGCKRYRRVG